LDTLALRLQVFLITFKYSAIVDFHNLQFTVAHVLGFPVFTSRHLATDLNTETIISNHYEVFLSSTNFPWLSPTENSELTRRAIRLQDNSFARTPRKTTSPVVLDACLRLRCLAIDFLQLRGLARRTPHRKYSFPSIVACIRVYKAVAWQRVDQIRYNIKMNLKVTGYERVDWIRIQT
jgi:hypothetical protein